MPKRHNKPEGDIPYVTPGSTDPEGYEATSKDTKKARREWARENQAYVRQELSRGRTRAQLGISDEKEGGRSMNRQLNREAQYGFQDPNYSYDFENGRKMNHATSDENGHGWVPIDPSEMEEYRRAQARGGGSIEDIYKNQANSQYHTWAAQNAVKGGSLREDEHGFYMSNDDGSRIDFDPYGNLIDANSGQAMGDYFYGDGANITGYVTGQGYKSPWAIPGGTPAAGPKNPQTGPGGKLADQPSATTPGGFGGGAPSVAGPASYGGGAVPRAGMPTTRLGATDIAAPYQPGMGNSWNRQAVGSTQPATAAPSRGMGPAPSTQAQNPAAPRAAASGGNPMVQGQQQQQRSQPRRITFAY